jgi:hypothetical protein
MIRIDEPHPGSMARRRHSIPPAPRPPLGWHEFRHVIIARSYGCFAPPWHDDVAELQAMASAPEPTPRGKLRAEVAMAYLAAAGLASLWPRVE